MKPFRSPAGAWRWLHQKAEGEVSVLVGREVYLFNPAYVLMQLVKEVG